MMGEVYSASRAMKLILAGIGAPQPSHCSWTSWPSARPPSCFCGRKKRALMLAGGSSVSTAAPAGTHSPSRYSTSTTSPATRVRWVFWSGRQLVRPLALAQVGQFILRPRHAVSRFLARGPFAFLFQHERGGRFGRLVAAVQVQFGQGAADGGRQPHVVGLDIAGEGVGLLAIAGRQQGDGKQGTGAVQQGVHGMSFDGASPRKANSMRWARACSDSTNPAAACAVGFCCKAVPTRMGAATAPAMKAMICGTGA